MLALVILAALGAAPAPDPQPAPPPTPRIDLPAPRPVPRTIYKERRRAPYFGQPRPLAYAGVRLALGPGFRLAGPGSDRGHFALDILPTARIGLHRGEIQTALVPTLGYSLTAGKFTREHLLVAGLGLGATTEDGTFAVIPALVYGTAEKHRALGLRTALLVDFRRKGPVFEIAHQALWLAGGVRHELRFTLGFDLRKLFTKN